MKLAVTLAFCFIVKVSKGNTVLQSSCQLDLETTLLKSLELLKNAVGRGECPISCLDGWIKYQGSCYLFGNTAGTFAQAEEFCAENGGNLVHINNSDENDFLKESARERTNWSISQPDDGSSNEDCAELHSGYGLKWNDRECDNNSHYPLCERIN
ncbi:CLC4G-like protein [Mya arenaria]|uniref:CLC4G-like protein n=1 Tax=Mya arenaria TaxID=6604 RepID=A0ABY7DWU8_MYAAR|nr:CLC4G-like protein [Mya arenaria]